MIDVREKVSSLLAYKYGTRTILSFPRFVEAITRGVESSKAAREFFRQRRATLSPSTSPRLKRGALSGYRTLCLLPFALCRLAPVG